MTYEQHKKMVIDSSSASNKFKNALLSLDSMDCVKALNYARTLFAMMEKRVIEIQGVK